MSSNLRIKKSLALIGACLVLGLWSGRASAQVIDCNTVPPGALQSAINSGQTFIRFTGTCNEQVFVERDGTYIEGASGNPALDVIDGGVFVFGAQNVQIEDLTIRGYGSSIVNGSVVFMGGSVVENTDYGLFIARNSVAWLEGNTFGPALIDDAARSCLPICVGENSYARLQNNTVNGATDSGAVLDVYRHSSILIRGGNTITNSGTGSVLSSNQGSLIRQDDAFGNGTDQITGEVEVFLDSIFDTRQAVITGEVSVRLDSILRTGSSFSGNPSLMRINGRIALSGDSSLFIQSPLVTINGDVTCADGESSASGTFAGTGKNLCSGFSSVENDFNGDGKADVLWRNDKTGNAVIWLMDGDVKLTSQSIGRPSLDWLIVSTEDYNGDGKADIMWRHTGNGNTVVWLMDGTRMMSARSIGAPNTDWKVQ